MKAPRPTNDSERVRALARYRVLDTPPEPGFDRITRLCASLFDVRIALVNLVPLQYMSLVPGALWMVGAGISFVRSDR